MNFALIGSNISHSKSPEIYKKLIQNNFNYDLLDIKSEEFLPKIEFLKNNYLGVNITSPYKRYYFKNTIVSDEVKKLGAINCIRFENNCVYSTNTDFLAMKDLIKNFLPINEVYILGSGVMAQVTAHLLNELNIKYKFLSRKLKNLDRLDQELVSKNEETLVINCLSRDVKLSLKNKTQIKFWDLNYGIFEHDNILSKNVEFYKNGESLLLKQAEYSIKFWKL